MKVCHRIPSQYWKPQFQGGSQCLTHTRLLTVPGTDWPNSIVWDLGYQIFQFWFHLPDKNSRFKKDKLDLSGDGHNVGLPVLMHVIDVCLDIVQCFGYFRPCTGHIALGLGSSSCQHLSETSWCQNFCSHPCPTSWWVGEP